MGQTVLVSYGFQGYVDCKKKGASQPGPREFDPVFQNKGPPEFMPLHYLIIFV